jgi:hypothetical protein
MPASTLNGRLLCASQCAYAVQNEDGVLTEGEPVPYYEAAGYLARPAGFVRGPRGIHACLVGTTPDGVVLAFRGTLPPLPLPTNLISGFQVLLDWMNNFNAPPVRLEDPDVPAELADNPGRVHAGFYDALNLLWEPLRDAVLEQLKQVGPDAKLFITGHSKGGAIAPLAAWRFHVRLKITARVVTFAGARCATAPFVAAYNDAIAQDRFEFSNDIVPYVPPSLDFLNVVKPLPLLPSKLIMGFNLLANLTPNPLAGLATYDYQPTGTLQYIASDGSIVSGDTDDLTKQRQQALRQALTGGQYEQVILDHLIECSSGYIKAICPTGVCPPGEAVSIPLVQATE